MTDHYGPETLPVCGDCTYLEFTDAAMCHHRFAPLSAMLIGIPEGYRYDGASIPRWAWCIFGHPLSPEFRWASLFHDKLCEDAMSIEARTHADAVFLELLREAGVSQWRRLLMWAAVRLYGIFIWRINGGKKAT